MRSLVVVLKVVSKNSLCIIIFLNLHIYRKRMPVSEVKSGQTASFALKRIKRSQIRKGMVMVCPKINPVACWEFSADIMVLHHPTTIATRYQAMVSTLFRNKRFALNELFQRNASKFAIFYV